VLLYLAGSSQTFNCFKHDDGNKRYWTAGQKTNLDSDYMWKVHYSNGTTIPKPMGYTNWATGRPKGRSGNYCILVKVIDSYQWIDRLCTGDKSFCFLCEIDP